MQLGQQLEQEQELQWLSATEPRLLLMMPLFRIYVGQTTVWVQGQLGVSGGQDAQHAVLQLI